MIKEVVQAAIAAAKANPGAAVAVGVGLIGLGLIGVRRERKIGRVLNKIDNALYVDRTGFTFLSVRTVGSMKLHEIPQDPSVRSRQLPQC